MKTRTVLTEAVLLISLCGLSRADFKYSEQSKMTGGALMQMTQTLGKFSKNMRQANEPVNTTTMVKGNRMREEKPNSEVQIIDLDGRRFIYIDDAKKQYSIVTFDEFKAAMQQAQERAKAAQQQQAAQHPETQNVKITPKFDAQVTGATRNILGLSTNEMKLKMEMEVQGTDPKTQQQQTGSYIINSDAWMAPSIPGYEEINDFRQKMAKELNWLPGTMSGAMGMNMQNPQMGSAMEEFRKNAATVKGMPMLTTTSMTMGGMGNPAQSGQNAQTTPQQQTPPPQQTQNTSMPTSASGALAQGLGGMFGGLRKRKQEQQQQQAAQNPPATQGTPGSLMDITTEVTAFSSAPLDSSLFDVPVGYAQIPKNADEIFGAKQAQH